MVLGAQGGPRITTAVFQAIVNRLQFGMRLPEAVTVARFHHQWKPAALKVERFGFGADVLRELSSIGYDLEPMEGSGRMQAIERFPEAEGRVWGFSDPRTEGAAVAE
jgi:gamma-glutamyltranspeptidase